MNIENTPQYPMENATSFPIEKVDNKSHSIMDVPSVIKEDSSIFAAKLWQRSRSTIRLKASSRSLGMCLIINTITICFYDFM